MINIVVGGYLFHLFIYTEIESTFNSQDNHMPQPYMTGIDIGTGSIKAVSINQEGKPIHSTQIFYSADHSINKDEQDPLFAFEMFKKILKKLIDDLKTPPQLISLSTAMHSIFAVDKNGKPLMNALLWSDTRSHSIAENLRTSDDGKTIYEATGTPIHAMSPLCKIRWIKENQPEVFERAYKFISIKEFIWQQLFAEYKIDYSMASATGLFNIHSRKWEANALNFAGINEGKLSEAVSTTYTKQLTDKAIAEHLSLPVNTIFCIGSSDGCLANLGSLCLNTSTAAITIGTSAAVRVTTKKPLIKNEQMIFNYLLVDDTYVSGGALNNGGNIFAWLVENFLMNEPSKKNYDEVIANLGKSKSGSNGLVFLPYLYAERAPVWDEKSSGAFVGIRSTHDQNDFKRAVIEGICFALKDNLTSLESEVGSIEKIKISGGVTQHKAIMQILTDVLNKPVVLQNDVDASALGAAYLGLQALNSSFQFSSIISTTGSEFVPEETNAAIYEKLFSVYKTVYPSLKNTMHLLS